MEDILGTLVMIHYVEEFVAEVYGEERPDEGEEDDRPVWEGLRKDMVKNREDQSSLIDLWMCCKGYDVQRYGDGPDERLRLYHANTS